MADRPAESPTKSDGLLLQLRRLPIFDRETRGELRFFMYLGLFGIAIALFAPLDRIEYSICYFYNATALPCPGCGLTRSVIRIFHLNFAEAWFFNPFGYPVALAFVFFSIAAFSQPLFRLWDESRALMGWSMVSGGALLIVFGLVRIALLAWFPEAAGQWAIIQNDLRLDWFF